MLLFSLQLRLLFHSREREIPSVQKFLLNSTGIECSVPSFLPALLLPCPSLNQNGHLLLFYLFLSTLWIHGKDSIRRCRLPKSASPEISHSLPSPNAGFFNLSTSLAELFLLASCCTYPRRTHVPISSFPEDAVSP